MASGIYSVHYFVDYDNTVATRGISSVTSWKAVDSQGDGTQWSIGTDESAHPSGFYSQKRGQDHLSETDAPDLSPGIGPDVRAGAFGYGTYPVYLKIVDFAGNIRYYGSRAGIEGVDVGSNLELAIRDPRDCEISWEGASVSSAIITELDRKVTFRVQQTYSGFHPAQITLDINYYKDGESKTIRTGYILESSMSPDSYITFSNMLDYQGNGVSFDPTSMNTILREATVTVDFLALRQWVLDKKAVGSTIAMDIGDIYDGDYSFNIGCYNTDDLGGMHLEKTFSLQTSVPDLTVSFEPPYDAIGTNNTPGGNSLLQFPDAYPASGSAYVLNNAKGISDVKFHVLASDQSGAIVGYKMRYTDNSGNTTETDTILATITDNSADPSAVESYDSVVPIQMDVDGSYAIEIYATDLFGRNSNTTTYTFVKDTMRPELTSVPKLGLYNASDVKDDIQGHTFKLSLIVEDK